MATDFISAVGRTAMAVAAAREVESRRPDAWFTDPLSALLFRNRPVPDLPGWLIPSVSTRTRFLDELVLTATASGVTQVVIVGAGLDARAFRMDLPDDVSVFEVDRADVLDLKKTLIDTGGLAPTCSRQVVVTDVTDPTWLGSVQQAGWRPDLPTLWLLEGFLMYFAQEFRVALLTQLAKASAHGSLLGATLGSQQGRTSNALWFPAPEAKTGDWMSATGWHAQTTTSFDAGTRYGRPPSEHLRRSLQGQLIHAIKSDAAPPTPG